MPTVTLRFRGTRAQLHARLATLPSILVSASTKEARNTLARAGNAVLDVVVKAFRQKSRGRADATGLRWQKTARRKVYPHGILIEKGILVSSLMPAKDPTHVGTTSHFQVFRLGHGKVEVGTSRPFAALNHKGVPGKLPARPIWPRLETWPPTWGQAILTGTAKGFPSLLRELLQ